MIKINDRSINKNKGNNTIFISSKENKDKDKPKNTTYNSNNKFNMFSLAGCNMPELTSVQDMFRQTKYLQSINLSGCSMSKLKTIDRFFWEDNRNVISVPDQPNLTQFIATEWNAGEITSLSNFFYKGDRSESNDYLTSKFQDVYTPSGSGSTQVGYAALSKVDFSGAKFNKVSNIEGMFKNCPYITSISFEGAKFGNEVEFAYAFYHCFNLKNINLNITNADGNPVSVSTANNMFDFCPNLESISFQMNDNNDGLAYFNTAKSTNMRSMFYNCKKLDEPYYRYLDYSSCTNISNMLYATSYTNIDFSDLSFPRLTNMSNVFSYMNVIDISFRNCKMDVIETISNNIGRYHRLQI